MPMFLLQFYRTGKDLPVMSDREAIGRIYERKRLSVFSSLLIGYSFYYVCRLVMSVAKQPMLDAGILNADQMGTVGSALFFAYAFGKVTNGFLADWSNIARFMATGLLISSLLVISFGFTAIFWLFFVLWGLNGWFQSMGSAPTGAALSQWFSNKERGTRYGIWSCAHPFGSAFSYLLTAWVVAELGWRQGFWFAGGISLVVAVILFWTLADRPQTYGLPPIAEYKNDFPEVAAPAEHKTHHAQWRVITNPFLWILGLSSACMYISRYGIESWGIIYLQETKAYTLIDAGFVLAVAKFVEAVGTASSGIVSDYIFNARRNVATLMYGIIMLAGLAMLWFVPSAKIGELPPNLKPAADQTEAGQELLQGMDDLGVSWAASGSASLKPIKDGWVIQPSGWFSRWRGCTLRDDKVVLTLARRVTAGHLLGASLFSLGLGGLLVFLGGLIAIDICPKRAAGAAMGVVGMFSYLGASLQDKVTGVLLQNTETIVNGHKMHDFTSAYTFWFGAGVVSILLYLCLWNVKARD